ncbi:MAG: hypothetical protein ACK5L3_03820 [Oscillospiraceae bacterium]
MLAFFKFATSTNLMKFLFGFAIIASFVYGVKKNVYYKRTAGMNFWVGAFGIGLVWALFLVDSALENNFPGSVFLVKYRFFMPILLVISVVGTSLYSYKKVKSVKLFIFLFLKQIIASPAAAFGMFLFPMVLVAAASTNQKRQHNSHEDTGGRIDNG